MYETIKQYLKKSLTPLHLINRSGPTRRGRRTGMNGEWEGVGRQQDSHDQGWRSTLPSPLPCCSTFAKGVREKPYTQTAGNGRMPLSDRLSLYRAAAHYSQDFDCIHHLTGFVSHFCSTSVLQFDFIHHPPCSQ